MLQKAEIPRVSVEFVDHIRKVFSTRPVTPDTKIENIMFDAGKQEVLRYIERCIGGSQIIGDPEEIHTVTSIPTTSKLDKILNIFK